MSAAPVNPWATKPGAWALDAEEHEEELNQQRKAIESESSKSKAAVIVPEAEFPSLSTSVATKGKKKNKGQTLSLAEFSSYNNTVDLTSLPTGPRERSAEEIESLKLGGGFRGFGDRNRSDWRGGERRDGGGEERRSRGVSREPLGPSRADEVDDWGAGKKSFEDRGGFERSGRSGGGGFSGESKADEVDNWAAGKKNFVPSEPGRRYGGRSYDFSSNGGADADTWGRKRDDRAVNGSGDNGSSVGRPKLNLKPRTLPLSTESRPQSPDVLVVKEKSADVLVVKKSSNPFGAARPREEVLAEKGQDWKKIDEQFESLRVKERPGSSDSRPDSAGSGKRSFWRGDGGEDKTERSWKKAVEGSSPSSAGNRS